MSDEATLEENLEDDERWDMTTDAIVFVPIRSSSTAS